MILIANLIVEKKKTIDIRICYILLGISLLLNYFISYEKILAQNILLRTIISSIIVSLPIFFAAIIFAVSFKKTKHLEIAFGSNLLGALIGGFFEYSSLAFGIRSLCLFALGMYIFSFLALGKKAFYIK